MAKKPIFVAAAQITGGTPREPHVAAPGTVIDGATQKQLGMSDDEFEKLVQLGTIVQQADFVGVSALPSGQTAPGTTGTEFEGMSIDAMREFLDDRKVPYPEGANGPDLMKIALEHQHPSTDAIAAADIAAAMEPKAIKAELDKLQVPYEAGADRAALSLALARARAGAQGMGA